METPVTQELQKPEPIRFHREVVIDGRKYNFDGTVPQDPGEFEWSVSVPDWEKEKPKLLETIRKNYMRSDLHNWLRQQNLDNGRVGVIEIDKMTPPPDNFPSIALGIVKTFTLHLSEELGYHKAKGVGSFLLDNLCALADAKGWRIYLNAVQRDWGLSQEELVRWYKKRGFKEEYKFPPETHTDYYEQRHPQEPDTSQEILSILQESQK